MMHVDAAPANFACYYSITPLALADNSFNQHHAFVTGLFHSIAFRPAARARAPVHELSMPADDIPHMAVYYSLFTLLRWLVAFLSSASHFWQVSLSFV